MEQTGISSHSMYCNYRLQELTSCTMAVYGTHREKICIQVFLTNLVVGAYTCMHKRIITRFRQAIDKPHIRKLIVTTGLDFENQKDRVVFWFGWQLYTLRLMFTVQAQIECHSKLFEHIIWIMATSSHIKKGL